jgi:hypothetical protein
LADIFVTGGYTEEPFEASGHVGAFKLTLDNSTSSVGIPALSYVETNSFLKEARYFHQSAVLKDASGKWHLFVLGGRN